jgi:H+/Cl- antiporter ClcA
VAHPPPHGEPAGEGAAREPAAPGALLRGRGYRRLLLVSALAGVPVSLAAFGFLGLEHELQHLVWERLPRALGEDRAPWWWPLAALPVAGLLVAPVVTRMPGHGGHVPARGFGGGGPALPGHVPGTVLAALICLPLGAVLGPEAPLMGLGSGLALMAVPAGRRSADPRLVPVLGTAGSAAAIATVFGSPLVAGILIAEAAGAGGARLTALLLPALLASGIGGLVFTGFGHWTGLHLGTLSLPSAPRAGTPDAGDFLWGIPLAVLVALLATGALAGGRLVADRTGKRRAAAAIGCAGAAGLFLSCYALATGRPAAEAALSGQATLAALAADPQAWPVSALVLLVLFKGLGWAACLGALRGGPIFPAILIGAAAGTAAGSLPGLGIAPGLGAGMAAATAAVTRLPLTATVLATLLVGVQAEQVPLLIVAALAALATAEIARTGRGHGAPAPPARPPDG